MIANLNELNMDDPYRILGVERTADWSRIEAAYRERARKHHPDRGGDAWAFCLVQNAFEKLEAEHRNGGQRDASTEHKSADEAGPAPTWESPQFDADASNWHADATRDAQSDDSTGHWIPYMAAGAALGALASGAAAYLLDAELGWTILCGLAIGALVGRFAR